MNPFDKIYETDAHHAAVLAEAFCCSNSAEEFWAVLRFACARDGRSGGFYQAHLDGNAFTEYQGWDGSFNDANFDDLKDLANKYRDECSYQSYKLEV